MSRGIQAHSLFVLSLVGCTGDATPAASAQTRYGDQDCRDFGSWEEAQAFYEAEGGPRRDKHRLDADRDGEACEALH